MNKISERRKAKIYKNMTELFNLYLDDYQPIKMEIHILDMHYELRFDAKKVNDKEDSK